MRRQVRWLAGTALMAGASIAQTGAVEALLQDALQKRYPAVSAWHIEPFEKVSMSANEASDVRIVQLGSRSAVRVGRQTLWFAVKGTQPALRAARYVLPGQALAAQDGIREASA